MKKILISIFALLQGMAFAETGADNSKINKRDRGELTADQQKMNKQDVDITRLIRRELVEDDNLSTYAKNIKIITVDGTVTLKGPVRTKSEVLAVAKKARSVKGVSKIVNEIEIAPNE